MKARLDIESWMHFSVCFSSNAKLFSGSGTCWSSSVLPPCGYDARFEDNDGADGARGCPSALWGGVRAAVPISAGGAATMFVFCKTMFSRCLINCSDSIWLFWNLEIKSLSPTSPRLLCCATATVVFFSSSRVTFVSVRCWASNKRGFKLPQKKPGCGGNCSLCLSRDWGDSLSLFSSPSSSSSVSTEESCGGSMRTGLLLTHCFLCCKKSDKEGNSARHLPHTCSSSSVSLPEPMPVERKNNYEIK